MIRRTTPIKRSFADRYGPARANRYGSVAKKTICSLGHRHPSELENSWCEALQLLERGKVISDLRFQVRHNLYLKAFNPPAILGWCSCFGMKNQPAPEGFRKFRGIVPDFEYCERGELHTVEAKGKEFEEQQLAYFIFSLIHGREVELRKRMP